MRDKKMDIIDVEEILIRITDTAQAKQQLAVGDKITCNGGMEEIEEGYVLKRETKIKKIE